MGQLSRMNRCDRFIDAFNEFAEKSAGIKAGDKLEVVEVFLCQSDSDECVRTCVRVKLPDGTTEGLEIGSVLFDPEYGRFDEDVDWVPDMFGITAEEYEKRMTEADLD